MQAEEFVNIAISGAEKERYVLVRSITEARKQARRPGEKKKSESKRNWARD